MNTRKSLRELAKSTRAQNIFLASKEHQGIRLFNNCSDFSLMQELYLNLLYTYNSINQDIIIHKISRLVLDKELYTDAYILWKNEKGFQSEDIKKTHDLELTPATKINFNKKVNNK
jgi:hypothetical protein